MSQFKIYWRHENNGTGQRGKSQCIIDEIVGEQFITVSEGISVKHPNDPFDRHIGISESFKKAVAKVDDRNIRKQLWEDFLSHRKIKKSIK